MLLVSVASALAAPSVNIGNTGLFRPRGAVQSRVQVPGGAPGTFLRDIWVADGASGLCRLTAGALDLATCFLPGVFEPMDYQVETQGLFTAVNGNQNGVIFVAGTNGGTGGVFRLQFKQDPLNPTRTVVDLNTVVTIFGPTSAIANQPVGRIRAPVSAKIGPDGKLYILFQNNGDIWRIKNPLSPTFTIAGNAVERVGTSDNGKTLTSMAWIGHDLWVIQAGFLNRIQNADACNYTLPKCQAVLQFGKLQTQEGMVSDQYYSTDTNGRWLYFANGNRVVRFDTLSSNILQVWNQSGFVAGSAIPQEYSLIMGLNFIQPERKPFRTVLNAAGDPEAAAQLADNSIVGNMLITEDPILEAPIPEVAVPNVRTGLAWRYNSTPTMTNECVTSPSTANCIVTSLIGNDNPPTNSPAHDAARRSVMLLAGITHPKGLLWLQSNFWVSDKALGFCRIDQGAVNGLSHCFKPTPLFEPGQAAADNPSKSGTQNVYVPDVSGSTNGIVRLLFTPDATGGTVSQTGVLNSGTGHVTTVALPNGPFNDGALYVGYYDNNAIWKISAPATAPSTPQDVGGTANAIGVINMAFNGNDLYLAELGPPPKVSGQLILKGQVTVITSASPSLVHSRGTAIPVTRALSRLQSPPQLVFYNPSAIVVGPYGDRPGCLPPQGVKLSAGIPADPATAPALFMGSMGVNPDDPNVTPTLAQLPEVDQYGFLCTTQVPYVLDGTLDPNLSINAQLGPVTALGFAGTAVDASLAIGDDPSLVIPFVTLQRSKIGPPVTTEVGQGHIYIVP
jgi:hypothetical protein